MTDSLEADTPKLELTTEIQTLSSCERRVQITVSRTEVERYYEQEFDDLEKSAYVPGFRAGKAPRKLVEKRFKKEVGDRVKNSLVVDALGLVGDSKEITPISEPDFDYAALVLPDDGPFVFEYRIEVRPDFDLPNWKNLKIERPVREFSKEDVDKAVDRVRTTYGTLEPSSEPAISGDYIVTKLTFKDGEAILGSASDETVRLKPTLSFHDGSIADFDKALSGVTPGHVRTVPVQLTQDAANPELRGKTVDAVFEITDVKRLSLPTMDEAFLSKLGGYDNEGDFRDAVLDAMKRQLEHEQRRRIRRQITERLTVAADWELPPRLLERQSEREFRRAIMELQRSGYPDDDIRSQMNLLRQNSRASTAQALKEHFILEKIAEVEGIEETQDDYDTEIALIAAQSGITPRRARAQIEKSGDMDILRNQIIERKVIDLIAASASFKEVAFNYEETDEEAIDFAVAGLAEPIAEVTKDDLKAVHKELGEKKMIDPNTKVS